MDLRVRAGFVRIEPQRLGAAESRETVEKTAELAFFEEVMVSLGSRFKMHARTRIGPDLSLCILSDAELGF